MCERDVSVRKKQSLLFFMVGSFINRKSSERQYSATRRPRRGSEKARGSLEWLSVSDLGVYDARSS